MHLVAHIALLAEAGAGLHAYEGLVAGARAGHHSLLDWSNTGSQNAVTARFKQEAA